MAVTYSIAVNVCDQCGHRWLPEARKSSRCPQRDCRSRHWNDSGKVIDADDDALVSPTATAPENLSGIMARLGLTTASKMHEQSAAADLPPVEHDEPELPPCAYTEYDPDSGETYRCGLRQHSFKVKHTRGSRV